MDHRPLHLFLSEEGLVCALEMSTQNWWFWFSCTTLWPTSNGSCWLLMRKWLLIHIQGPLMAFPYACILTSLEFPHSNSFVWVCLFPSPFSVVSLSLFPSPFSVISLSIIVYMTITWKQSELSRIVIYLNLVWTFTFQFLCFAYACFLVLLVLVLLLFQ